MSWNVLVVPEDPTYNGYLLRPLCQCLLREAGRPSANIRVLPQPRVRGYAHAKKLLSDQILRDWWHFDLILFIPDADGLAEKRKEEFKRLEQLAGQRTRPVKLICCAAEQELEAWLLSGYPEKLKSLGWRWAEIRAEISDMVRKQLVPALAEKYLPAKVGNPGKDPEKKAT